MGNQLKFFYMAKVYPQTLSSSTPVCSKQQVFTLLMKSLILGSNGCTVFDSDGCIVYRVDNYHTKCSKQVHIMDAKGEVLFTIVAKKLSVLGLWEGYRPANTGKKKKKPEFRVTKVLNIRKVLGFRRGASSFKVVVGLDKNQPREYVMEAQICKSSCKIVDNSGKLVAEVKRKITNSGVVLGEDVLTMVVEPYEDHCLIMGLVVVFGLILRKM
ncbi:protein LURP-one-related 11-like [Primulina tabacum]|uniref:protein LURP-one-related 11-like n=1 Tax=Primulina tabacum TaxID=48773 RepID=UPI003F5AD1AD